MDRLFKQGRFIALSATLFGCGGTESTVSIDTVRGLDPTASAPLIAGTKRTHAWVVAGVENQPVYFKAKFLKSQPNTNNTIEPESLNLNGFSFSSITEDSTNTRIFGDITLQLSPELVLPARNETTGTRFVPYIAKASYGPAGASTTQQSVAAEVEILRPYCNNPDAIPFSTLGMTFESPSGIKPPAGWPTILFVHGGKLTSRNHVDMEAYAKAMLENGFAVANMNYRLIDTDQTDTTTPFSTARRWNDPVADVKCAIRYLKQNSSRLNVDSKLIGIAGHSSGANIALQAAVTPQSADPNYAEQGTPISLGVPQNNVDTSVAAIFTMDVTSNIYLGHALLTNVAGIDVENYPLFYAIYGVAANSADLARNPVIISASATTHINSNTELPIFMAFSTDAPKVYGLDFGVKLDWWRHGCAFYNAVIEQGSATQFENTKIKEYTNYEHNDFFANKNLIGSTLSDMKSFFGFYLKNTGATPTSAFDYSRCVQ